MFAFKVLFNIGFLICVFGKKPNIIFILTDDMGWNDVGFHGSNQIPTPNIDALAYNGVIMNRFYTQHICTPSRAALLTGNYPIRSAMQGFPLKTGENRSLPEDMPLLPEKLKELGYKTHLVGKWHLGFSNRKATPTERGFDTFFGYWNGFISYFNYNIQYDMEVGNDGFDLHENLGYAKNYQGKYATDLFTDRSLEIIENHHKKEPLFLMLSHLAAHTGNEEKMNALTTPDLEETNKKFGYVEDPRRRNFTDIVYQLDKSIGRVMEKLSQRKMLENTIIVYMHDNGAQTSGSLHSNSGSNWPLRGQKFTLFEGGVRGTCVVWSPLLKLAPYINNHLMHITDWMPTLYEAAGGDVSKLGVKDGISQWDYIQNNWGPRPDALLNIDEKKDYSAYLSYFGKYKLVNGSFPFDNGMLDLYEGESGRGANNPKYNVQDILDSPANKAINKIIKKKLTAANIEEVRVNLDLTANCNLNRTNEKIDCKTKMCLFDLLEDPCEEKNIIDKFPVIAQNMSLEMQAYYKVLVPQAKSDVEKDANPKLCDGKYYTWQEKNGCPRNNGSLHSAISSATNLSMVYLVLSILLSLYYF